MSSMLRFSDIRGVKAQDSALDVSEGAGLTIPSWHSPTEVGKGWRDYTDSGMVVPVVYRYGRCGPRFDSSGMRSFVRRSEVSGVSCCGQTKHTFLARWCPRSESPNE